MNDYPIGVPTPVPGYPQYCVYEVGGGEYVAVVMRMGDKKSDVVDYVPCEWAMERGMPRIVALVKAWERTLELAAHDDDDEIEPPVVA